MSVPGLLIALVLLVAVTIMVVPPLFEREKPKNDDSAAADADKQRERLLTYYNRVLTNIRDLDEDWATGKINQADYETERELWMQRGIQALKALDEDEATAASAASPAENGVAIDPVEQAVAAYREKAKNAASKKQK
jgi:hypothetical protein